MWCTGPNNSCPSTKNQIRINNKTIHIHHWLIHTIALLVYLKFYRNRNLFVIGIIVGGILHGLTYEDWYILTKNIQTWCQGQIND